MKNRKKVALISLVVAAVLVSLGIYFSFHDKKPVIYIPREVKINGVYLADFKETKTHQ